MTGKEKALERIRLNRKTAEKTLLDGVERMREDDFFDALYRKNNALKWEYIRCRDEQKRAGIDAEIQSTEKALDEYMRKNGILVSAFRAPYSCKKCDDTGKDKNGNDCTCVEKTRLAIFLEENATYIKDVAETLQEIDFSYYGKEAEAKKKIADVLQKEDVQKDKRFFLFAGKTGTAKTYFASVFLRELLQKGKDIKATSAIRLNRGFLEYHCAPMEKKNALWNEWIEPDALLIDDLGAEQVLNNVTIPYLLELLTERTGKITILTTNLSPTDLEQKYGQRILSRLLDKKLSCPILFGGSDLRF